MTHPQTRFTLIRHGETDWNVNGRWQGQASVPLNALGQQQAAITAAYLSTLGVAYTAIYASDLSRAAVTAALIAQKIGLSVQHDPRLREIDVGEWQGLTEEEVRAWDAERLAQVRRDPQAAVRPSGESWQQVSDRAMSVMRELHRRHPTGEVLVVSHGGTIRSVLSALALAFPSAPLGNCSRTLLSAAADQWTLDAYNLTDHLALVNTNDQG
jgi:broad specificity phosphatase PhoE